MLRERRKLIRFGKGVGSYFMEPGDIETLESLPAANQVLVPRMVVRRGGQLMVVFKGCPAAAEVQALRLLNVNVGLALSRNELAGVPGLDDFRYVFVGCDERRCLLKKAVADLAYNGWSIDDNGASEPDLVEPLAPRGPKRTAELVLAKT